MPELDELMKSTATTAPVVAQLPTTGTLLSAQMVDTLVTAPNQTVNTSAGAVDPYSRLRCETNASLIANAYNHTESQLINSMIAQNSYKSGETISLTDRSATELTFSDLTPPVPNVSTLESNRLITVDTSLPTVDGVSGAVPESKDVLIQQMSSITTESPSIEIPTDDPMVPSMAPKLDQSIMDVSDGQYSNMFEPVVLNGPSGSAPQTPAASPLGQIEQMGQQSITMTTSSETAQMPIMSTFEANSTAFVNNTVSTDMFSVPMTQMMAQQVVQMSNTQVSSSAASDGPLPVLGVEPSIQEQLLDAIPPPSVNFPPGPVPTDECGIPTALPGEFPLSLLPVEEEKVGDTESASVPLDKIEATINMNANSVPTLTNAVSLSQAEVNLIKSLPQTPQSIPTEQSSPVLTNPNDLAAQQQFNLNYSTQLQTSADGLVYSTVPDVQTSGQSSNQSQTTPEQTLQQQNSQTLALQSQQQVLTPELVQQQQTRVVNTQSIVNLNEGQLPPAPAAPSATSIAVFEANPNDMMPEMVTQTHLSNVLPSPAIQSAQTSSQSMPGMLEMNTLTNLVPVVETNDQSLHPTALQPISVVVKTEPQSYIEPMDDNTGSAMRLSKVNDDNNNPIHRLSREKESVNVNSGHRTVTLANSQVRDFPLCVISTTPTTYMSKNITTIVSPKYELILPPKKAKFATSAGLVSVSQQSVVSSLPSKMSSQSQQAVPSTGMLYDLPQQPQPTDPSSHPFRVQSGLPQAPKHQHNMSAPFTTTVSPILFSGLMPSVSVAIDGPLSLIKEEKMRQLITTNSIANHPDYPAISGLLSFINPYHKPMTTSLTTGGQDVNSESPLALSIKHSLTQPPVTANQLSHSHSSTGAHSSHVPSLSRPLHQNQNITTATTLVHTPPSAVPVSVVTSVVDQNRGLQQRIKTIGQNNNRNKINIDHNSTGPPGVKLQLAPLLSGDPAKPFQCALCGKHLASKNVYQLHLRSHSGEKPFTCSLCGHSFSQKTSLTRHMRSHTGERPFPCQVCGKRFADKERIKIHMRTHTGEKPFACEMCGKQFSQKSTVKRHMSVHTGEKPFKCETCGKGFANRGNLTAHTKTHSNS